MRKNARGFTFVELLVVIAALAGMGAGASPLIRGGRPGTARRTACANNEKQVAIGYALYWKETHAFPGYRYAKDLARVDDAAVNGPAAWVDPAQAAGNPPGGHGARMLVAMADMLSVSGLNDPALFSCPANPAAPFAGGRFVTDDHARSLLGMENLSYSLTFGMPAQPPPSLVVHGDRARYGADAPLDLDTAKGAAAPNVRAGGAREADEAMGVNHAGEGFNLLYGDGHVKFARSGPENRTPEGGRFLVMDNYDRDDNILLVTARDRKIGGDDTGLY